MRKPMTRGPGQGRGGAKRPAGRGPGKPKIDPIQAKAREIMDQTGLPLYAAVEIARGKWTVEHAFDQVRLKAEMHRIVREHGLSLALAGQVARGQLGLEAAILCAKMKSDSRLCGKRSVLEEAHEKGEPIHLSILGGASILGPIVENEPYTLKLGGQGQDPVEVKKHDLALACTPGAWVEVQELLGRDESVSALGLKGTANVKERLKAKDRDLFPFLAAGHPVAITLRDGTRMTGIVAWFGRWEVGVELAGGVEAVTFRHALHAVEPAGR